VGQQEAVSEMSLALAKKLGGLSTGNVLMIGSSGTGKTTLMRAVEDYLAADPRFAGQSAVVRLHANVLGAEATRGRPGEVVLLRLLDRAREQLGEGAPREELLRRAASGFVFVDEIDKIRSTVGGQAHIAGIRAQEALLTLIENESVALQLPDWMGGGAATVDASGVLFIAAGAFEGLYDAVYDRLTVGADRGTLQAFTVVGDEGTLSEETHFALRDWLTPQDLFDYGMSPQFLSRFDSLVLLDDLDVDSLVRIFLESPQSGYGQSRDFFAAHGLDLVLSPAAVRRIATEAARQPRLGARALQRIFRRVIQSLELDPAAAAVDGAIVIDVAEVEAALQRG
jgi:ATP-dependent Clp protease ATP-binding subunit ClpX